MEGGEVERWGGVVTILNSDQGRLHRKVTPEAAIVGKNSPDAWCIGAKARAAGADAGDTDDGVMGWIAGCRWGYRGSSEGMPMAQNCKSLTREKELKGPMPCFPSLTDQCLTGRVFVRCLCP